MNDYGFIILERITTEINYQNCNYQLIFQGKRVQCGDYPVS